MVFRVLDRGNARAQDCSVQPISPAAKGRINTIGTFVTINYSRSEDD
jgi:hypothetical protein